jgi:hypothetical protein
VLLGLIDDHFANPISRDLAHQRLGVYSLAFWLAAKAKAFRNTRSAVGLPSSGTRIRVYIKPPE